MEPILRELLPLSKKLCNLGECRKGKKAGETPESMLLPCGLTAAGQPMAFLGSQFSDFCSQDPFTPEKLLKKPKKSCLCGLYVIILTISENLKFKILTHLGISKPILYWHIFKMKNTYILKNAEGRKMVEE